MSAVTENEWFCETSDKDSGLKLIGFDDNEIASDIASAGFKIARVDSAALFDVFTIDPRDFERLKDKHKFVRCGDVEVSLRDYRKARAIAAERMLSVLNEKHRINFNSPDWDRGYVYIGEADMDWEGNWSVHRSLGELALVGLPPYMWKDYAWTTFAVVRRSFYPLINPENPDPREIDRFIGQLERDLDVASRARQDCLFNKFEVDCYKYALEYFKKDKWLT